MPLVIDASVILAWLFEDETSAYAERTLEALQRDEGTVPSIWTFEVANSLLVAERRGRSTMQGTEGSIELLNALPISISPLAIESAFGRVLALARDQRLTAYDAAYLDLALQQNLPLATEDKDLRRAARRVGVSLF
jgi:predicted nucleic acid-binding protein